MGVDPKKSAAEETQGPPMATNIAGGRKMSS
jgi:hypothetical protein